MSSIFEGEHDEDAHTICIDIAYAADAIADAAKYRDEVFGFLFHDGDFDAVVECTLDDCAWGWA